MAIDTLQYKIRKGKSALMVDMSVFPEDLPPQYRDGASVDGYCSFCRDMMSALKGKVPALRFSLGFASLLGVDGPHRLSELLRKASAMGFYVLLDVPEIMYPAMADFTARSVWGEDGLYPCDGVRISAYLGSDMIRPFLPLAKEKKKDLFVLVRSHNKSAGELQDLLSGSRLVHAAAADYVNRFSEDTIGKSGFARVAVSASATSADSLRSLRSKYSRLFILADGMDRSGGNAKNASMAFDQLGHGAVCCVSSSVTCAWKKEESDGSDCMERAVEAAERHNKNLSRYFTIL